MPKNLKFRPITALVAARCRMLGHSERTCESYAHHLACFEDWSGTDPMDADQELASAWLAALECTRNTRYHCRMALVFLFQRMRGEPVDRLLLPPIRRSPALRQAVADPWQVANLLAGIANPRLRVFCQFLYATGLRIAEARAVRIGDLDEVDGSVAVRHGKGMRSRRSLLPASLIAVLRDYRATWKPSLLLFPADACQPDRPLDESQVNDAIADARRRCGLACHVTAHRLRHCFATHLHERGVGVVELQRLLGHSSVFSTLHYIGGREERRRELRAIGDLLAALPAPRLEQQRICFSA
jgi:integrase